MVYVAQVVQNTMSPDEYEYRELQKINEHLRRENHLLRLLDELKRETNDTGASTSVPVPGSQDTLVGDIGEKNDGLGSAGTESQDTLVGEIGEDAGPSNDDPGKDDTEETGQKMDVDAHGDKTEGSHKQPGDKHPKDNEEEEEEEENSQYDESNASEVQSESTEASSASDEDSKDEIQPEVQLLRELHRCNSLAHRNAVISMYKRDKLRTSTMRDNLHIGLHQELQRCFNNKFYSVGYCTLDASLYMACESNPAKRTDVWVYQHLYGLHPALVSCIGESSPHFCLVIPADMPQITSPLFVSWTDTPTCRSL